MGCREHAGHVFAKVCAPNTKAAMANRINTSRRRKKAHDDDYDDGSGPGPVLISCVRILRVGRPLVLPSFLPPSLSRREDTSGRTTLRRRRKGRRDIGGPLTFRILGRDLVSPLCVIAEGPSRNVIAHYVREIDCIQRWRREVQVAFRLREIPLLA